MIARKRRIPTYPDGVLEVCRAKERKTEFGARRNPRGWDDLDVIGTLCFSVASMRDQDYEFADRAGFKLSLKLRCPRCGFVTPECMAVVDGALFDVSHVDSTRTETWLYLEEVCKIDPARHP